ncbi:Folylpolyglutamate synthetase [Tilletia horrida]|nr:Folylpolyglutamate synthetase [Tilletia horrida]
MSTQRSGGQRTYADAIEALNTLQSNAATIEAIRKSGGRLNDFAIPEMVEYLGRIGYTQEDLNRLNVIHITGTKGKGSTSAFTSSLLQHASPGAKIGLYTSPHMIAVRERIRINGSPLDEADFADKFWHVWDALEQNTARAHEFTPLRPIYFRFLTLLAFHTFLAHKVDTAILEVGIGGMYDSTNIVPRPVVCGITALGMDHVAMLGNTIELIAAQKAGIYKHGSAALAVRQLLGRESAEKVLEDRAKEVGASSFHFVRTSAGEDPISSVKLGLPGIHQYSNASLALALAQTFVRSPVGKQVFAGAEESLGPLILEGGDEAAAVQQITPLAKQALEAAHWPGRCQRIPSKTSAITYFLDGAHTTDSLALCARWFLSSSSSSAAEQGKKRRRVFIFNCTNGRSGPDLLGSVLSEIEAGSSTSTSDSSSSSSPSSRFATAARFFTDVAFCTNTTFRSGRSAGDLTSKAVDPADLEALTIQNQLKDAWLSLVGSGDDEAAKVHVLPSIEDALLLVKEGNGAEETQVLVSGSLHLVGGVMAHLREEGLLDDELRSVYA